uniref:Uncharacterized protein n=1 Tax=Cacopsylla melanoneura TaxID=428564 RepID=A0A8D8VP67_9HEMI
MVYFKTILIDFLSFFFLFLVVFVVCFFVVVAIKVLSSTPSSYAIATASILHTFQDFLLDSEFHSSLIVTSPHDNQNKNFRPNLNRKQLSTLTRNVALLSLGMLRYTH